MIFPGSKLLEITLTNMSNPERLDVQAQSLNFFNSYAVKARIDSSHLEDRPCLPDFTSFQAEKLLPTLDDDNAINPNFTILIARVLKKHFPFFKRFATGTPRHIKHDHYSETAQRSEVVSESYMHVHIY